MDEDGIYFPSMSFIDLSDYPLTPSTEKCPGASYPLWTMDRRSREPVCRVTIPPSIDTRTLAVCLAHATGRSPHCGSHFRAPRPRARVHFVHKVQGQFRLGGIYGRVLDGDCGNCIFLGSEGHLGGG